jgi:glutamate--cysteine ligase
MEAYLDRWGPAGRTMMRRTASLQVNLEASDGTPGDLERRWGLLHTVGPPLVAAFANSPGERTGPWKGWACSRMGVWLALDPARTRPPRWRRGCDPARAWTRWCLDAPLMLVRRPHGPWTAPAATFREWIDGGHAVVPDRPIPRLDDLAYHLTTLFPPVRARGHLEVRYLDAQPGRWWPAPAAVLWALVTDPATTADALSACAAVRGRWREAARKGLADDAMAAAALRLIDIAAACLDGEPATAACADLVRRYRAHWTARRRSPADDLAEGRSVPEAPQVPPSPITAPTLPATPPARKDRPC